MIIFVFFNFLAFWPFPWQRQPFWKNQPFYAQLHMAYAIPTRFHKIWSRHLREIERTKMCGIIIIIIIIIIMIIVKKTRRITIHHPGWRNNNKKRSKINMSPKFSLGDIINDFQHRGYLYLSSVNWD